MSKKVFFVTFEGTDGVGKSTHARLASQWLTEQGFKNQLTREPGGGPVSEKIRALLLDPKNGMQPLTELLLYQAARAEHLANVIRPALASGTSVICDRFTDATLAYQGYARGLLSQSQALNDLVCETTRPDLTLLFDLAPTDALRKAHARDAAGTGDRLEQEGVSFQERVREGYLQLAKRDPSRIKVVHVKPDVDATHAEIQSILSPLFHGNTRTASRS